MKRSILVLLVLLVVLVGLCFTSRASAATQNAVLTWTDLPTETSYAIERKVSSTGTYVQVGTVGASVTTFRDLNLAQGTAFCWRVTAVNAVGAGVPSDDACMGTAGVPGKVGGLNVLIEIVP